MTIHREDFAASTDPGARSPEELEREVRQNHADVKRTLDAIEDRLSPRQFVDQVVGYLRDGDGNDFARKLGHSIQQNPMPAVLVGVGLAWMMFSGTRRNGDVPHAADPAPDHPDYWQGSETGPATGWSSPSDDLAAGAAGDPAANVGDRISAAAKRAKAGLSEAAERAREGLADVAGSAREAAGGLAADAREGAASMQAGLAKGARRTSAQARRYGQQARAGVLETLHRQPLVLGALGLAVGAAIGAALPASRREDELMGETRDQLKERIGAAGREEFEKAKATASAAYTAAGDAADEQGLSPAGLASVAEAARDKVERVAQAATEAAAREADRQRLAQGQPSP